MIMILMPIMGNMCLMSLKKFGQMVTRIPKRIEITLIWFMIIMVIINDYDDDDDEYNDDVIDKVWLEGHKNPQESGQDLFVGGLKLAPLSNIIMMMIMVIIIKTMMMIMMIIKVMGTIYQ